MSPKVAVAFGTRPEKLKQGPVIEALRAKGVEVVEYDSVQSPDLTGSAPSGIIWNDGLTRGIADCMKAFRDWLRAQAPHAVLVQGDTATAFACALAAFLEGVPVGHVEAGLRTYASEPFPEEALRRMIAPLARWHFAPDEASAMNVFAEMGCPHDGPYSYITHPKEVPERQRKNLETASIFITGNPIIDTLPIRPLRVLVTLHRRENWGERISDALLVLEQFERDHMGKVDIDIIRHPNWPKAVSQTVLQTLIGSVGINLREPAPHATLIEQLQVVDLVLTDSGGLQEEAAALGVPCLVLRTSTERTALVANGAVKLIDPDRPEMLRQELDLLLARRHAYGTGDAGERIATILLQELSVDDVSN